MDVKDYYGKVLKKSSDLKSNACVAPAQRIPAFIRQALKKVHPEVTDRFNGLLHSLLLLHMYLHL